MDFGTLLDDFTVFSSRLTSAFVLDLCSDESVKQGWVPVWTLKNSSFWGGSGSNLRSIEVAGQRATP
jgi:hypothetical protein